MSENYKLTKKGTHSDIAIMKLFLVMSRESLCPPTYNKFWVVCNELISTRRLPLRKL